MKNLRTLILSGVLAIGLFANLPAAEQSQVLTIRTVDFKQVIEKSKLGKKGQENFEGLKSRLEKNAEEKMKELKELADKSNDRDYIEGLSPDAHADLTRDFRTKEKEYAELQNTWLQMLQQANVQILQKIAETVQKASQNVAKANRFDLILNSENTFFANPTLDVSSLVVDEMDKIFAEEEKTNVQKEQPTIPGMLPQTNPSKR